MEDVEAALHELHMSPTIATPEIQPPEVPVEATCAATSGATAEQFAFFIALDRALIKYVTSHASRLFNAENPAAWRDFYTANAENAIKYGDFTPDALCEEFVQRVLPEVFACELTEREVRMLQLLKLHPEFERVAEGYIHVPWQRRVASCREPKPNVDFRVVNAENTRPSQMFLPAGENSTTDFTLASQQHTPLGQQHHTLLVRQPFAHNGEHFSFSQENAALLSAALSNNFELSGCVQLETKELHQRLRQAKLEFEQHAHMPENCKNATELLAKMQKLKQLRETVVDITSKRYL